MLNDGTSTVQYVSVQLITLYILAITDHVHHSLIIKIFIIYVRRTHTKSATISMSAQYLLDVSSHFEQDSSSVTQMYSQASLAEY